MNKTLNSIASLVNSDPNYKNIERKLDFDGFESKPVLSANKKRVLKIAIPSTTVLLSCATCLLVLLFLSPLSKQSHTRLTQFNDNNAIAVLASIQLETPSSSELDTVEAVSIQSNPGLDKIYESFLSFKENTHNDMSFFYETRLLSEPYYTCYYLPQTTIKKIEDIIKEETPPSYLFNNSEVTIDNNPLHSYLRIYWYLYSQNKLFDDDKLFVSKERVGNKTIDVFVEDCVLVKVTRNLNIQNEEFGNYFVENVKYKYEEKTASVFGYTSFVEKYDNKKIVFINAPYLKTLFGGDVYNASFLDNYSYLINETNNTFETFIEYDKYLLDEDEHYYDAINGIIISKEFITSKVFNDNGVSHEIDAYHVVCDYNKAINLFEINK